MRRRALLRAGGAGLASLAGLAGAAGAHPTPTGTDGDDDGTESPTATPTPGGAYAPLGRVDVRGATEAVVGEDGTTVFVAATTGYAVVDVADPESPRVLAERRDLLADREDGPLEQVYDVKHDGDTLLVVAPANALADPYLSGVLVVDVSDPANPRHRAFHETTYPIHNCYLDGDTAYLTANGDSQRLEILDVGGDGVERLGDWTLTDHDEGWAEVPRAMRPVHDVFVQDGVAYVAHWDAGTWLLDVRDPAAPTVLSHVAEQSLAELQSVPEDEVRASAVTLPGNSHYVAVDDAAEVMAVGREAWAVESDPDGGPGGVDLYDVGDPTAPRKLATVDPPATPDATFRGTWTTSHNFEFRDGVLYTSWYRGGVKRHDVTDPADPVQRTWWAAADAAEFWTARAGVSGETFVASSRGTETEPAGVFVFPDAPGRSVNGLGGGSTPTESGSSQATPTGSPSPTPTQSPTPTPTASPSPTVTTSPGVGLLGTAAALGTAALGLLRRRGGRSEPSETEARPRPGTDE